MTSFDQLGVDFVLYQGPVEHASRYSGTRPCHLCGRQGPCLTLGIGFDLVLPCTHCGQATSYDCTGDPEPCPSCGTEVSCPSVEDAPACLDCLRGGKFAITKDTEVGMVSWADTLVDPGLRELVHTPDFESIQGSQWLVHCETVMVFLGRWGRDDYDRVDPTSGGRGAAASIAGLDDHDWAGLGRTGDDESSVWSYAFRCPRCGVLRGSFDFD